MFTDRVYLVDAEKAIRAHVKASKSPVYYSFYSYVASQPTAFRDIPNGTYYESKIKGNFTFKFKLLLSTVY